MLRILRELDYLKAPDYAKYALEVHARRARADGAELTTEALLRALRRELRERACDWLDLECA